MRGDVDQPPLARPNLRSSKLLNLLPVRLPDQLSRPLIYPSLMFVYCYVVIFAETMERDLVKEQLLGDIILGGGDPLSFLNDTDGQEGEDHGSGD